MNDNFIFVFGSNLAGRHGKGAALHARVFYGAEYGVGEGLTGSAYAIPTKDRNLERLPLSAIERSIRNFAEAARENPDKHFLLTPVGCGLAGYSARQIRPLFEAVGLPGNVEWLPTWQDHDHAANMGELLV